MIVMGYAIIVAFHVVVVSIGIFLVSSCIFDHESTSIRSATRRMGKYLASEPVTFALATILCSVHLFVAVKGSSDHVILEYGVPNDNAWAYIGYAFLHDGIWHLVGNVGSLLVCGGLIEHRIGKGWFLVLIALSVPLGGYLTILTAPAFIDSPWEDGRPSIGFSIVVYAIYVLFAYLVIVRTLSGASFKHFPWGKGMLLAVKECHLQFDPLKWSPKANQVLTVLVFSLLFSTGISQGLAESVLGHSIGAVLGAIAVMACVFRQNFRRQGMTVTPPS